MGRPITSHEVNGCNAAIRVDAVDPPGRGGASREYLVQVVPSDPSKSFSLELKFHTGPVTDGPNGITHEVLLAILIDRLRGFQNGPFACPENLDALSFCEQAAAALGARTRNRMTRGVEGTHEV